LQAQTIGRYDDGKRVDLSCRNDSRLEKINIEAHN